MVSVFGVDDDAADEPVWRGGRQVVDAVKDDGASRIRIDILRHEHAAMAGRRP